MEKHLSSVILQTVTHIIKTPNNATPQDPKSNVAVSLIDWEIATHLPTVPRSDPPPIKDQMRAIRENMAIEGFDISEKDLLEAAERVEQKVRAGGFESRVAKTKEFIADKD